MQRFALLAGVAMVMATSSLAVAQSSSVTTGPNGLTGTTVLPDRPGDQPCRVIGSDGRQRRDGGALSSTVTAGPNGVHSSTSGGNGPSVTVRSRDGSSSSSSSASSSGSGTSVVTGSGSGDDCTVYYNRGRDDRRENDD